MTLGLPTLQYHLCSSLRRLPLLTTVVDIVMISGPLNIQGSVGDIDFGTLKGDGLSKGDQGFKGHHGGLGVGTQAAFSATDSDPSYLCPAP